MKQKKVLSYVGLGALALSFYLGFASPASAFLGKGGMSHFSKFTVEEKANMHQTMFEEQAKILGISSAEVKEAWSKGVGFMELAKSKGISEETLKAKMKAQAEVKMQEHLQALVSKGVITEAQADTRLTFMKDKLTKMAEKAGKGKGKKIGHMMGMGIGGL
jgi:hypothetical protein